MYQTFAFGAKAREDCNYFLFSNRWGGRGFEERRRMAKPASRIVVTKRNGQPYKIDLVEEGNAFGLRTGTGLIGRKYPVQWFSRPYGRFEGGGWAPAKCGRELESLIDFAYYSPPVKCVGNEPVDQWERL